MLRFHSLRSHSWKSLKYGTNLNSDLCWKLLKKQLGVSTTQRCNASTSGRTVVRSDNQVPLKESKQDISPRPLKKIKDGKYFKPGLEIEGFVVQQVTPVPDFHLTAIRLLHTATGAQYLHIDREDSNNAFSIGFRTTPSDSTGLPHILEHTTLCGSKTFPCRDPFFKMLNRSMATFMNAMTGPDYTMYPFSTQNPQDYNNLMSVYLDAVFRPRLQETDFQQEGWRLEHEDVSDPSSPIVFKGVVFNEMKGVFAENQSLFGQQLLNSILPSHTYGHVSGGDPLAIPSLTYTDLKAFHKNYYNPSNARFYSYGSFPLVDHLKYVNEKYLAESSVEPEDGRRTAVPREKRWGAWKRKHIGCREDPLAANPRKQSSLAVGFLCSDITDVQETFVLQVLSDLLVKGPNSAFYKSLVESNIGAGFSPVTGYDAQTKDTIFSVGLQGLDSDDFEKVIAMTNQTIDNVVEKGFEENHIEGILHGIELNVKHQSTDFGLGLLFGLTPLWNHGGDLIRALNVASQVSFLRKNLKVNPRYLQEKVAHHFKSNTHRLILTMSPEKDFEEKQAEAEKNLLQSKLSQLSETKKVEIYEQGKKLLEQQQKTEDTSCLPSLKIADLKKDVDRTGTTQSVFHSVPVQMCSQGTNGITYFRGILNTVHLPEELKMMLPLFTQVATKMGTTLNDYRKFDQLVQLKTGGLGINNHVAEDLEDLSTYEEGLVFSSYCLDRNVKGMFKIWTELFNDISMKDEQRFNTLVQVLAADLVNGISDMGHHYAMSSAASLVSPSARRKELVGGLSYIKKMREVAQMGDLTPILESMETIAEEVFNKNHLRCAVNMSPENQDQITKEVDDFVKYIPGSAEKSFLQTRVEQKLQPTKSIHHVHSIPVNFAAKSISTVPYKHLHFAPLRVLSRLVTSKYLHPNIREKGGAYGSGLSLSSAGILSFYSYRDPNSTATFNIFDNSLNWVKQDSFTDQDIEEAKLGVFQNVDAPVPPGSRGLVKFLYGMDDDLRQSHRMALMAVDRSLLHEVAEKYLMDNQYGCARALIGPENKDLFTRTEENWEVITQE